MSRKSNWNLIGVVVLVAVLATTFGLIYYFADLPQHLSQHETIVLGQNTFVPGSQSALRILVRDSKDGAPLANAAVRVEIGPRDGGKTVPLYTGKTDAGGNADVAFKVPENAARDSRLVIKTRSSLGSDTVERDVTIERDYRILLTTDKPIYQPGQLIHVRALALSTFDLYPAAGQELEITIADGKGNKVFRQSLTTTGYGVAFTDFQLAGEVNTGDYKITAVLGNTASEKTVTVEHYVLPKFEVKLETGRSYYQPGQRVQGTLRAGYFYGKPVAESQVKIEGFTFDVQQNQVVSLEGITDAGGNFSFEFDLPAYLAGSDLDSGLARLYLRATVIDQAQHAETASLSLPVAGSALVIQAVPEGSVFRKDIENILYVLTSAPDGSPAPADLRITFLNTNTTIQAQTGEYGLAEVRFTPDSPSQSFSIQASDARGATAKREFHFSGEYLGESVLLRPEKPVYRVGETMKLNIFTSRPDGTVYLDIVREGQAVSTRAVDVANGKAEVAVDLGPDLYGTLELHAYKVLSSGAIARDTRLVVVSQAEDLGIAISAGQDTYLPGDTAGLEIQVSGRSGEGVSSAVGLAIVDESVFALAETDPGFAKLYFLLENEILQPRYDLHGYSVPDLVRGLPSSDPALESAVAGAAQASLSEAVRQNRKRFSLEANSHEDAMQRAYERQRVFFANLGKALVGINLLLPLALAGLALFSLRSRRVLGKAFAAWLGILAAILLVIFLPPLLRGDIFDGGVMDWIGELLLWLSYDETALLLLALLGIASYLALIVIAIRRKDSSLGWTLGLLPLFLIIFGILVLLIQDSSMGINEEWIAIAIILAFFLVPLVLLLRMAGDLLQKRFFSALLYLSLSIFLVFGVIPVFATSAARFSRPQMLAFDEGVMMDAAMPAAQQFGVMKGALRNGRSVPVGEAPPAEHEQAAAQQPPRLRQYFPETMLWLPDAETGPDGTLRLEIPVADSITTWRMTALASSQDGRLGSATAPLRVFQDFFIDLDLPLSLTVGDEVAIPVGVFNYLGEEQAVKLELEQAGWFDLQGEPVQEMVIAANDISVVYFRIRANQFGMQPFKVTAWGSKISDAIQKEVRVYPDGKEIRFSQSDRLNTQEPVRQSVSIPADAIPGTQKLLVKVYPGVLSQVVEGLDSILRMPMGCFEQTSSSTYPNVLVLDYLKTTKQAAPEAQMKAEEYINLGYQRLTTFEVESSGGFSLFGQAPADRMLTAYGLQEFSDMSRVHSVDSDLLRRAAQWLYSQQSADGSWENDRGLVHEDSWSSLGNDRLPVTAYITWSLVEAGFADDEHTQKGLQYVREYQKDAEDPYVLGLVANALVAADLKGEKHEISSGTTAVLDRLAALAQREGQGAYWKSGVATFMGSEGQTGSIETTALAALALLRAESNPEVGNAALVFLVQQKDSYGTWHSTQATVLTLKALLQSVRGSGELTNAALTITLNDGQVKTLQVTPQNFDVVQMVVFDDINIGRENIVSITAEGKGALMYQVTGSYYLPWDALARYPQIVSPQEQVKIDLSYDRAELAVNDTVTESVSVTLTQPGAKAEQAIIDLGIPPGFSVQTEDLDALVARYKDTPPDYAFPKIERYELTGRQILLYVTNLSEGKPLAFTFRIRARFPLSVQSPASSAYDYYNPDVTGETPPQRIVVNP